MELILVHCNNCENEVDVWNDEKFKVCPVCENENDFQAIKKECNFCKGTGLSQYSNDKPCVWCKN
jgi:anaerobic ribonucleoside-triphosphate reductase